MVGDGNFPATEFARFSAWLREQAGRSDSVGTLAADLREAAACRTLVSFRQHLRWYGHAGAVATLEAALAEYRMAMRTAGGAA